MLACGIKLVVILDPIGVYFVQCTTMLNYSQVRPLFNLSG